MSAYEQRVEPPDKKWQYLLFAAEPYETISFKVSTPEPPPPPCTKSGSTYLLLAVDPYELISLGEHPPPIEPLDKKW